jgi:hypothetical protein
VFIVSPNNDQGERIKNACVLRRFIGLFRGTSVFCRPKSDDGVIDTWFFRDFNA